MTKEKILRLIALCDEGGRECDALWAEFDAWNPENMVDRLFYDQRVVERDEARKLLVQYLTGAHTSWEEPEATYRQRFLLAHPEVGEWIERSKG